jgi:opacity protein-like surface antigen
MLAGAAAAAACLVLAGAAEAAQPVSCTSKAALAGQRCGASAGPLVATMVPSTHDPKINAKWPLEVNATLKGKPAHASAEYQFLLGFTVVSTQYPRSNKHFTFLGQFSDDLVFPPDSKGEPLTLQVVIADAGHTVKLDWAITPGAK